MSRGNVLHLGDPVTCHLSWAERSFPVIVRRFDGPNVYVVADPKSDDPTIENEWWVPFSWITRRGENRRLDD